MSDRMLKVLEFTLFYPHTIFIITAEGKRRKTIENEIPVKVLLDVDTVHIINAFDIGENPQNRTFGKEKAGVRSEMAVLPLFFGFESKLNNGTV